MVKSQSQIPVRHRMQSAVSRERWVAELYDDLHRLASGLSPGRTGDDLPIAEAHDSRFVRADAKTEEFDSNPFRRFGNDDNASRTNRPSPFEEASEARRAIRSMRIQRLGSG